LDLPNDVYIICQGFHILEVDLLKSHLRSKFELDFDQSLMQKPYCGKQVSAEETEQGPNREILLNVSLKSSPGRSKKLFT